MIGKTRPAPNHSVRTPRPEHGFTLSSAGLLTCGSVLSASLPSFPVASDGASRSAHSCGGSHGFGPDWVVRTVFPFNPLDSIRRGTYDAATIARRHLSRQAGQTIPSAEMPQADQVRPEPVTDRALDLATWQRAIFSGYSAGNAKSYAARPNSLDLIPGR
jgi:hypothetical protein